MLDIFYKKGASVPSQKWRPAEVLEVVGDYITIHYLNWHDKYNERLHHRNDAHRLSVFGSKATRNVNSSSRGSGDSVTSTGQQSAPVFSSSSHRPRKEGNEFSNTSFIGAHKDHRINGRGFSVGELSGASESSELDRSSPPRRPSDSHSTAKIDRTSEQGSTSYPGYSAQREIEHTGNDVAGAGPSASATAQEGGDLTPEQHSFTRNFFNYRKKRDESDKKAASGVPVAVAAPAATGTTASERPEGFLRQVSMMSFTNMFGNREDNKNSDNNYKNNITGAAGPVVAVAEARAVDGGAATPTSPKSKSSTEERTQEEIAAKEQLFLEKLEAKGLHVFAIEGDGNCLFRAVSHQLYLHQDMHDELRACVVEHLIRHRKRFEVFVEGDFEEHLREMSKLGIWADDLEIRALEEITDRIIVIYSSDVENVGEEPLNNNFEERNLLKGVPPITLSYHGQSHYNSIYDERYPLPLVHRKSRLLLRSRTALSKQDHLAMAAGQVSATSDPASPPPSNQPVMFHPSANKNQPIYHHPGGYVAGYHQHHPGYPPALHPQYRHASQPQPQYQVGSASGSVSGGVNESSSVSLSRSESDDMPEIPNPHYSAPYAYYSAAQMQQAQAFALAHGQQYQTQQYYAPPPPPHMVPAAESGDSQEEDDNDFQDADNNGTNSNNSSIAYDAPQYGHPYVHPLGEAAAHYGVYMGRPAQQYGGYHYPQSSGLEYETATGAY